MTLTSGSLLPVGAALLITSTSSCLGGRFVHLTSTEILAEISKTLRYLPGFTEALAYTWYCDIGSHSQLIPPRLPLSERVRVCRDPDDDKFLECAIWGQADYLVSRDLDLLRIAEFGGARIIYPEQLVALLDSPS